MLVARGIGVLCQIIMALAPQLWPVSWVMVPVLLFRIGTLHDGQLECRASIADHSAGSILARVHGSSVWRGVFVCGVC